MSNEQNTAAAAVPAARNLRKVPGFDPLSFARETVNKAGQKVLTLDLEHKKNWFRLACPTGGLVLNALRVTDTMAIFEARLFADKDDRNPLASFTVTRTADKSAAKGQYIRAAQDEALSVALDNAGFDVRLCQLALATDGSEQAPAVMSAQMKEADGDKPVEAVKQTVPPVQTTPPVGKTAQQPKPAAAPAPRLAPVSPQPHAAEKPNPAPAAPQPHQSAVNPPAEKTSTPAAVVNIATRQPVKPEANDHTAQEAQSAPVPVPQAESAAGNETVQISAPSEPEESAPVTYTADMTVKDIYERMTLEQAKSLKVTKGTCAGWTLEQVAKDRATNLKWFQVACPFADNILKAASRLVLEDLQQKLAG